MILTCPECSTRFQIPAESLGAGRTVRCSRCSHRWFQAPPEPVAETPPEASGATPQQPPGFGDGDAPDEAADEAAAAEAAEPEPGPEPQPEAAEEEEDRPPVLRPERDPFADSPPPPAVARAAARRAAADSGGSRLATMLWVLLFLVVAGVVGSAIGFRQAVMAKWPAAEALYDAVGLGPEPPGAGLGLRNVRWKAGRQGEISVLRVEGEVANLTDTVRSVPPIEGIIYDKAEKELQRWIFSAPESRLLPGETAAFVTELKNPAAGAARLQIVFARRRPR